MQLYFLAKIFWSNLVRYGRNQNLASPKAFDLLRLWFHHLWSPFDFNGRVLKANVAELEKVELE